MKRLIPTTLALFLALSLCVLPGCNGSSDDDMDDGMDNMGRNDNASRSGSGSGGGMNDR